MARDEAQALVQQIKRDPVLAARILAAPDLRSRLALARAAGYPCSAQDLESLSGMLDDSSLDHLSGGLMGACPCDNPSGKFR